ncbi:putative Calcineurin-like phosphoesterase domain-containing protein [Seiridium unicorne]|uniref:Calcineurin-like phosphoesterase domain-containing protein n=1 Tax=Seiridium unicorne TaxID=138068 RepID=A0ABR2VAD6_9PEZI
MAALFFSPHLHPRTRRRRLFGIAIVLIFGTLYLCYAKFDKMAETAKTIMPLNTPFTGNGGGGSNAPAAEQHDHAETTFADLAAAQKPMPPMSYGTYARPPLKDLISLSTLPSEKLPTSPPSSSRLIIIGDVHGQIKELKALLKEVEYSKERGDHVIFTGDLINKGVDSPGVVQLAMDMGASGVRGNHEDRILLAWENANSKNVIGASIDGGKISDLKGLTPEPVDDMAEPALAGQSGSQSAEVQVARSLTQKQREWLSNLPVILKVGPIPGYGNVVVVHAGLVPDVALENQDPWAVMHMRTLVFPAEQVRRVRIKQMLEDLASERAKKHVSVSDEEVEKELIASRERGEGTGDHDVSLPQEGRNGKPWSDAWDESQANRTSEAERTTVVYGHDAKRGLNVGKFAFGLDSSCVKGGKLSAMIFGLQDGKIGHRIVSVDCEIAPGEKSKVEEEQRRKKRGDQ